MMPTLTAADLFCGAGGFSLGAEMAGFRVVAALNHDANAIACHRLNHPRADHHEADVWITTGRKLLRRHGQRLDLLTASPTCTHHSRAKGGQPLDRGLRSQPDAVVHYAREIGPRVIVVENVPEFQEYGGLYEVGDLVVYARRRNGRWKRPTCAEIERLVGTKPPRAGDPAQAEWTRRARALGLRVRVVPARVLGWLELARRRAVRVVPGWRPEFGRVRVGRDGETPTGHMGQIVWRPRQKRSVLGRPIPERKGELFQRWVNDLRLLGYQVAWRVLRAADYNTPTIRERLFVVARRDQKPIRWPEPTRGPGLRPYRTAAECIDWSVPSCSIFATPKEAKAFAKLHGRGTPKRPLADNTLRRVAAGIVKYVLTGTPFLVNLSHGGRLEGLDAPVGTLTATPEGGDRVLVSPVLTRAHGHGWDRDGGPSTPGDGLLPTLTTTDEHALATAALVKLYGKSDAAPVDAPAPTVTGTDKVGLTTASLIKLYGTSTGAPVTEPAPTVTATGQHIGLVTAGLVSLANGECAGQAPRVRGVDEPLATITATGSQPGLVTAFLAKHYGGVVGQGIDTPMGTVTAIDHHSVVAADLAGSPLSPEQLAGARRVAAFLVAYYGSEADGQGLDEPLRTITTLDRLGLVTVTIQGEPWVIVDIQLRMLEPHELLVAQGFPRTYRLTGTRAQQIARIGNSVCPPVVEALVRALFADELGAPAPSPRARPRPDPRGRPRPPASPTHTVPLFAGSNAAK